VQSGDKAAAAKPSAIAPDVIERVKPSVAFIDGKHGTGSGFLVLPNVVATNSHVVRDEVIEDLSVRFISKSGREQARLKPRLLFEDKGRDLALLLIPPQTDRTPLTLMAAFEPGPNKAVFVVGNPGQEAGFTRVNSVGTGTADEVVMLARVPYLQIKVANGADAVNVGPGNSGGPVFDPSGRVVGILTAGVMDAKGKPSGKHFCVPANALEAAVGGVGEPAGWENKVRTATARHALDMAVINTYLSGQVANLVLDLRADLARTANPRNLQKLLQTDGRLIDLFKTYDKQLRELAQPAFRVALESGELSEAQRKGLIDLRNAVLPVRNCAQRKRFSNGEYKHCGQLIEQTDRIVERLKDSNGLTDRVIAEMKTQLLQTVNSRIGH
jgi:S1-C subfamily serine protease